MRRLALMVIVLGVGCGGDDGPTDASVAPDSGGADGGLVTPPDIPWLADGLPPIAIAPCPDGWHEVADPDGLTTCDPYPADGPATCAAGEAHFPGESGCVPIGSPCPTGDFSDALPTDRTVVYVQPGATGGDGMSPASPYGSVAELSITGLPSGAIIALSRGTHTGPFRLVGGVVLWGACVTETTLVASEPSESDGVVILRNATGEVRDVTIGASPRGGIWLLGAASEVVIEGVVVAGMQDMGLSAAGGARILAHSVVVQDTQSRTRDGMFGRGLNVEAGGVAEVSRALFERNHDLGVFVGAVGASATLSDIVVRDTESRVSDGVGGRGLGVQLNATVEVDRALFERNRELGVFVGDTGGAASLRDVVIRDTEGRASDGAFGRGLGAEAGATVEVARGVIEGNRDMGVYASRDGTTVTLSDVIVRDTRERTSDGNRGRGLNVQSGASAEVTRALIARNRELAVFASGGGSSLTLREVVVRDTESRSFDGVLGRGVNVQIGARAELTRAVIDGSRGLGLYVSDDLTTATATDLVIRDVGAAACAETTCADSGAGHGLGVFATASASITRFGIDGAVLCGVLVARGGELDLSEGQVSGSPIGLCMQVEGYDLDRLTTDVAFIDNESNLQTTTLPVPEPAEVVPDA